MASPARVSRRSRSRWSPSPPASTHSRRPSAPSWSGSATRSPPPSDSTGLLALERRHDRRWPRPTAATPCIHLRLGFLSLRLGELGGQSHYDDAASEFQWAIDLQPTWPYAWYGMGLAEYGVGDSQISFVTGLKTMLGKDALTRSAMAFAKSAEVDPGFVRGLVELANTALRQRVNIKLGVALDALRRAGVHPGRRRPRGAARPRPGRARGGRRRLRARRVSGLPRRRDRTGAWASSRWRARSSCWAGSTASQPYFEGAASDDSVTVAGYRADLATIASRTACWGSSTARTGQRRAAYLKQFWSRARPRRAPRRGRAAPGALPPALLRPQELPAHRPQSALRHRRALPVRQPRLRRPRHHLHPPRRADAAGRPTRRPGSSPTSRGGTAVPMAT